VRRIGLAIGIFILIFSFSTQAATRVNINAERLDYFLKEEQAEARNNVVVIWEDNRLTCDELFIDFAEGFLTARGNVYFVQGDSGFKSQEITYYFEQEKTIILDARGEFVTDEVEGYVYLHSKRIEGERERVFVDEARVTTCELEEPHFFLRSSKVEVYPGDKLISRHVSFWELSGRLPVFYWPYLYISLKEREQQITPEVGYSAQRGFFVKFSYNYSLDNSYGQILTDVYTRTGLGFGIRHVYLDREDDLGRFYFYFQQDRAEIGLPLWQAQLEHRQETPFSGNFSGRLGLTNYQGQRIDLRTDLDWRGSQDSWDLRLDTDIDGTYFYGGIDDAWSELEASLSGRYNFELSPRHRFRLDGEYDSEIDDGEFDDRWAGSFLYRGGDSGLGYEVLFERRVPSIGGSGDHFYTIPEVKVTTRPVYWDESPPSYLRPFTFEVLGGYYDDRKVDLRAGRAGLRVDYNRFFRPFTWANLQLTQQGSVYGYTTRDLQAELSSRNRLTLRPLNWLSSTWTYTYRQPFGESPFGFDYRRLQDNLRGDLRLNWQSWTATVSSGRDFADQRFYDVTGQIRYRTSNMNLRLATGYSTENQRWRDVVISAGLDFDRIELGLGYRFNPSPFEHKKVEGQVAWQATEDIKLESIISYDISRNELDSGAIRMAWDLHCRQLVFSYDHIRTEFLVQYQILAFPGQRVQVISTPEEPMLFDLDLGDLFDDFME